MHLRLKGGAAARSPTNDAKGAGPIRVVSASLLGTGKRSDSS